MSDPAVTENESMRTLRRRRDEQGRMFWEREDFLAVLDAQTAQRFEAANFADLTMLDGFTDLVRGERSEPVDWSRLRSAWLGRLREISGDEGLRRLAQRMIVVLDAEVGSERDLVWMVERATIESLVPVIIDGITPAAHRRLVDQVLSTVAWILAEIDAERIGRWHKPKMILLQVIAGQILRRELRGRARGTKPRRKDLADAVVDLLPSLGIDRGVDAVTALLTAITGSPGAAAACALYELHRQHAWRARLEAELSAVPLDTLCEAPMRHAPIAGRFVKETLRIWSSPPIVIRRARTDIPYEDGCLKKDQNYILSSFLLHHDDRDWADPDTFDPDRWLVDGRREQCPHGGYVPFGWAPKACIGANLGMAQLVIFLHLMCTRYRLETTDPERARMAVASLVRPADFVGRLSRREPRSDDAGGAE